MAYQRGFSLIELVGVLAVLAILAAVLAPALLKQTDKLVADKETATLQSFGDALQRSILRNRSSITSSDWTNIVATELGMNVSDVATNPRRKSRIFLIDPTGWCNGHLPYANSTGTPTLPSNARLMILSNLGSKDVPLASGYPSPADFTNTWNGADGTVPNAGSWSGWTNTGGKSSDVLVQRINLSTLFVSLSLISNQSPSRCYYSIDSAINPDSVVSITNYFLRNSVLRLYNRTTNNLESQLILSDNTSLFFYRNVWCSQWAPATNTFAGVDDKLFSLWQNLSAISTGFYWAPAYPTATVSQADLLQDFMDYFDAYQAWADAAVVLAGTNDPSNSKYWPKDDKKDPYKTVRDLYDKTKSDIDDFVHAFAP